MKRVLLLLAVIGIARGAMWTGKYVAPFCNRLGYIGECEDVEDCLCSCYRISPSKAAQVQLGFFGELGYELMLYAPYAYYLHTLGMLTATVGPHGSAPFFYYSPNHTEVNITRKYCRGLYRNTDAHRPDAFDFSEWQPPEFKAHFAPLADKLLRPQRSWWQRLTGNLPKPFLIIANKYVAEWQEPPANFIDVPTLLEVIALLKQRYVIVYIRPHPSQHLPGFAFDHNEQLQFNDFEAIGAAHTEVLFFHTLLAKHPLLSFNELQLLLHSLTDNFVSVLGGNSVLASYFARCNIVYAVKGHETENDGHEYKTLYPRVTPAGRGQIVHVKSYKELLQQVQQRFL